jgi:hypothetical protein
MTLRPDNGFLGIVQKNAFLNAWWRSSAIFINRLAV